MIEIPLSKGYVAIVDDDCPDAILEKKWHVLVKRSGKVYAIRNQATPDGGRCTEYLHRAIMSPAVGFVVDHIDGDGLNNQRSNLRVCSNTENVRNSKMHRRNTSGFKGVSWNKDRGGWDARIMVAGKQVSLGCFTHKSEAAEAYDHACVRMHGQYAKTNAALGLIGGDR